ncbi:hypothetical protein JYU34_013652 [Plutella xylostella]|uniref:Uncharacterized protein n=1 Tax=Plutella xylostella TaxID=51655 RepID=A0ABQ7QAR2_PLUXY|nr:hypothetical protein JYU34_013652 [Plutella xylostella]
MTAPSDRQPMSEDSNDEEHPCTFGRKESKANLFHSFSEHNVLKNYVCLVSNIPPFEYLSDQDARVDINHEQDNAIQVERSKALYDIKHYNDGTSCQHIEMMDVSENDDSNFISFDNPNILQYTRMKWLSDGSSGGTNASSPSVSLTSCSTISSDFSQDSVLESQDSTDRCLSTILKLDEEHNMFGMTNMAIVGMPLRSGVRCEVKPAFPQTAIVQVCCPRFSCCKHKSKTDFPMILKCGNSRSCTTCCVESCTPARESCATCCPPSRSEPKRSYDSRRKKKQVCCPICPQSTKCTTNANASMTITVKRRPDAYEPYPVIISPRSSCILKLPLAARSCHHVPRCQPPSACCPYLTPCYWPARPNAPCPTPAHCFHNPPCPAARRPETPRDPNTSCPKTRKCNDKREDQPKSKCPNIYDKSRMKGSDCPNRYCLGRIPNVKQAIEMKYGMKCSSLTRPCSLTAQA